MNETHEINTRLDRVKHLRAEQRKLKSQKKELSAEIKAIDETLGKLLDEIEDIKSGKGVQETLV